MKCQNESINECFHSLSQDSREYLDPVNYIFIRSWSVEIHIIWRKLQRHRQAKMKCYLAATAVGPSSANSGQDHFPAAGARCTPARRRPPSRGRGPHPPPRSVSDHVTRRALRRPDGAGADRAAVPQAYPGEAPATSETGVRSGFLSRVWPLVDPPESPALSHTTRCKGPAASFLSSAAHKLPVSPAPTISTRAIARSLRGDPGRACSF